jgi:hypothetical protein
MKTVTEVIMIANCGLRKIQGSLSDIVTHVTVIWWQFLMF